MNKKNTVTPVTKVKIAKLPKVVAKPIEITYEIDEVAYDGTTVIFCDQGFQVFSFEGEGTPHCCGMYELGGITEDFSSHKEKEINSKNFQETLDSAVIQVISQATKDITCKTLIANLVDSRACNALKASFIRTGLFTLVKTYKNTNGRTITFWVSNN